MIIRFLAQIALLVISVGAIRLLLKQCRKPSGWFGRLILRNMNLRHLGVTNWGLSHVAIEEDFAILDVGCGGGRTVQSLAARASEGKVYGIDYSEASAVTAERTNEHSIRSGRVTIQRASVSSLPFPDGFFDLVTAVETHYYWPHPEADLREVLRVLKPGGQLVIIAESYKAERADRITEAAMKLLSARYLSVQEHRDLLETAGYTDVEIVEERSKGWLCAVGRKPQEVVSECVRPYQVQSLP